MPAMLALGAVLVMLPAFRLGLIMDDLPQRMVALPPERVPPRIHDLGLPLNSGSCSTVVARLLFRLLPRATSRGVGARCNSTSKAIPTSRFPSRLSASE
jgi:hypothetical protein